jgi:glycosyltransferase involved in cell wall biosynthesis
MPVFWPSSPGEGKAFQSRGRFFSVSMTGRNPRQAHPKKVALQVVPDLDMGGVESVLEHLIRHPPAGWQIHIVATRRGGQTADRIQRWGGRVAVLHHPSRAISPVLVWKLRSLIRDQKVQLVHCRCVEANLHGILAAKLAGGVPCVAEEVGLSSDVRSPMARAVIRRIYRQASGIIGQSQAVCEDLGKAGVIHPRIRAIHNPVGSDFFLPPRPLQSGPRRFLSVGRLVPEKNLPLLLRAFVLVQKSHPKTSLEIVGDGPLRGQLEAEAKHLGLNEAVRFLGQQPHDPRIFASAEIFVMSSSREGHPLALLEAMAAGLPVLATRVGGIPEIVEPEDGCGWLVSPNDVSALADAMERMAKKSGDELQKMGQKASEKIRKHFSHQNYLRNISDFYEEVLG